MCGIFGCIGKISANKAYECIEKISYRGPDALQVQELEGATLAHARLSIVDISDTANQPMVDCTGRYWIVYNGEVYNYIELREELKTKGYHFRTECDTEVLLYAYIEWGAEFQNKCNGMWALAIWDDKKKELFLSRDRFGVKPLYIFSQDGNFYFASEMKALFPIMKDRKVNTWIFREKRYFFYEGTRECCIKGITKVLAGHCGKFYNGSFEEKKWWCTIEHLIDVPRNYGEQIEYFRELFLDACKIRMRCDVPLGTALSGGVDSSAVMGAMRYIADRDGAYAIKDWQHAFVASMPGTMIDETETATKAADYIGVDIEKVTVIAHITPEELLQYMYICEDPYITSPIPFIQTYKKITEAGVRVTLDGHGADELFCGYENDIFYAGKEVRNSERKVKEIWRTYNEMTFPEYRVSYEQAVKTIENLRIGEDIDLGTYGKRLGWLNGRLYYETHRDILPTLLRCYDRYSMANGLEIRMPFLDYRIVCFAFSISWRSKLRGGYTKSIVRDMASPFMCKEILYKKGKIGFNSPMTEWLHGDLKEFLLDTIHSKDFYECELVNPLDVSIKVNEFYKQKKQGYAAGADIWTAIVPYLWKKAVMDSY